MSHAVVDAGGSSSSVDRFGAEAWADEGNAPERHVGAHERERSINLWSELDRTYKAISFSRKGSAPVVELLRTLRPESHAPKPLLSWRHRTLPIADEDQFTPEQLEVVWQRYQKEKVGDRTDQEIRVWTNTIGMEIMRRVLGDKALELKGKGPRKSPLAYGQVSITGVMGLGLLDPANRNEFDELLEILRAYDGNRLNRDDLEYELQSEPKWIKTLLLGASAIRGTWRFATFPIKAPAVGLTVRWITRKSVIKDPSDIGVGLRLSNVATLVTLGIAGLAAYRFFKTGLPWSNEDSQVVVAGIDTTAGPDLTPDQPTPTETPTVPGDQPVGNLDPPNTPPGQTTDPPVTNHIQFSPEAQATSHGEGWIQQLAQMKIKYTPEFMDKIGPWLEGKGYAYRYLDSSSGNWSWGMNEVNIDQNTLDEIYKRAQEFGVATAGS